MTKVSNVERRVINADLIRRGMDGNGRFDTVGQALSNLREALEQNTDLELIEPLVLGQNFSTPDGHTSLLIERRGKEIDNSMVFFSWYLMPSDRFEIVAYLS